MIRSKAAVFLPLALFAILFAACPTVDLSGKGVRSPASADATAAGPVAGFGGLRVAGADFADNASTIVIDDLGRGLGDITVGMMATVRGTLDASYHAGFASTVTIEQEVHGPVADNGVSLGNGTIRVLGQTVIINPATILLDAAGNDISLSELKGFVDNDYRPVMDVHGSVQDNGIIRASYISWAQDNVVDGDDVELRGTLRSINADVLNQVFTFRVGTQTVNYARLPAGGRVDWPLAGLSNGLVVDIRGYISKDGDVWVVRTDRDSDRIAVVSTNLGNLSGRIALEGYVLSGTAGLFELSVPGGAITVTTDATTALSGDTFGLGKKVRVRGVLLGNDGRRAQASSVFVLRALDVLLEESLERLPTGGDTITLLGRTVKTDGFTMFRDTSGGARDGFGLGALALGNIVRVAGWVDAATGNIVAARLDRIDGTAGRVGIQGPASSCNNQLSLSITGFTVNINSAEIDYYDREGVKFSDRSAFCDRLGSGTIVRVHNGVFVSAFSRIDPPAIGDLTRMKLEIVNVNR